jgi:hypothetical protein
MKSRADIAKQRLKDNPPPQHLAGDLTRPHLGKLLECKDIDQPSEIPESPAWWKPARHGMEMKHGKTQQARNR